MTLEDQLAKMRETMAKEIPAEIREVMHVQNEDLRNSGQLEKAIKPGDPLPPFEMPNYTGEMMSSEALLAEEMAYAEAEAEDDEKPKKRSRSRGRSRSKSKAETATNDDAVETRDIPGMDVVDLGDEEEGNGHIPSTEASSPS